NKNTKKVHFAYRYTTLSFRGRVYFCSHANHWTANWNLTIAPDGRHHRLPWIPSAASEHSQCMLWNKNTKKVHFSIHISDTPTKSVISLDCGRLFLRRLSLTFVHVQ